MNRFRRNADEGLFEELARRHTARAYRVAKSLLGGREAAEDAVQECFLRLVRARQSYDATRSFSKWLYTILRNICRDERRRRVAAPISNEAIPEAAGGLDPANTTEAAADYERAFQALQRLSEADREALVLRVQGGLDFASIGDCCGIGAEAAKKRVYRALERLRKEVRKE